MKIILGLIGSLVILTIIALNTGAVALEMNENVDNNLALIIAFSHTFLVLFFSWLIFYAITKQTNLKRPSSTQERPKWFFAIWTSVSIAGVFMSPTIWVGGDILEYVVLGLFQFFILFFIGIIIYFFYRYKLAPKKSDSHTYEENGDRLFLSKYLQ